jgi:PAS domain S-box-containing protein
MEASGGAPLEDWRFRALFEQSDIAMVFTTPEGTLLSVNNAACALWGRSAAELVGMPAIDFVHPGDRAQAAANMARIADGMVGVVRGERRYLRPNGESVWAESWTQAVVRADGGPLYWQVVLMDVTARKQAEDDHRQLAAIVESSPDSIIGLSLTGVITSWNHGAEELYGYTAEEVIGRDARFLPAPGYPDDSARLMPLVRAGQRLVSYISGRLRKDGTTVMVSVTVSPIVDASGTVTGIASVGRDLTEKERARVRFEGLLEAAPDAIVAVDSGGVIQLANRQAEAMFGYRRDELIGHELDMLVPERAVAVHPAHRADYFAHPAVRQMGAGLELTARRRDGTEFPVDISLSSLETEDGILVSAAVRDVTERKRAQAEHARLEAELQRVQRDEERAVLEAQLHQSQRLESIGQLAGGIAHDFNNLLAGIMNYAALVTTGLSDITARLGIASDSEVVTLAQDVAEITKVAVRAAQLTHQLLIFSRREVVKPEVLDLNTVVTDMQNLLGRIIGEAIDLRVDLHGDLPRVKADRGQIEQVLMNLAVNARDAMARSGRLVVETAPFEVDADYGHQYDLAPGPYVRLSVSDTGTGMTPEVTRRAFEPFFTTKPKGEGSGLGLATVYGIVTQTGGNIVIYSESDLGTTIRVSLPASRENAIPSSAAPIERLPDARNETILLVEDEDIVREPARRMLVRHGYTVLPAANADEAVGLARDHAGEIDLLLTDVVMPGRSGKALAADLAELEHGIKVLYMSGYSQDIIVHQGILEEGVNLIEKPFAAQNLLRQVREVLDAR